MNTNDEWIEMNTENLKEYNVEVVTKVFYVKLRCLQCNKSFGANPRSDGKIYHKDLICRDCSNK